MTIEIKQDTIYHTATQEAFDELMEELETAGYEWISGALPSSTKYWNDFKDRTCVYLYRQAKSMYYARLYFFQEFFPDNPIIEYKTKKEREE